MRFPQLNIPWEKERPGLTLVTLLDDFFIKAMLTREKKQVLREKSSGTECPKFYRNSVLHLLKYRFEAYLSRYRFTVNCQTLNT